MNISRHEVVLRRGGKMFCTRCEDEKRTLIVVRYVTVAEILMLGRGYFLVCKGCGGEMRVSRKQAEAGMQRIPIPFIHRYGCYIYFAILGGVGLLAILVLLST